MTHNEYHGKSDSRNYTFFDSPREFAETCAKISNRHMTDTTRDGWMGGSFEESLEWLENGDTEFVEKAERLLDKIDAEIDSEETRPQWEQSVAGYIPLVPAFLAGTPENMLMRTETPDPRGDIEIWVEMGCSVCVSQQAMQRRGVILLAVAMALARVRNVRIVVYSAFKFGNMVIRLNYPIDIAEVCGVITRTTTTRRLMYGYSKSIRDSSIPWAEWSANERRARIALAKYAGMPENSEIITMQKIGDWGGMSDDALVDAINGMLHRHTREIQG